MSDPVINLNLFIDEEKKKVVFAEAGKDFVDILYSFLTLPMGTIVRLTEIYQKSESIAIGCFSNIYASVVNMDIEHFRTEACKQIILYPKCLNQEKCQNIKLRIDGDYGATKCFMCPSFPRNEQCGKRYSYFNTTRCSCEKFMTEEIEVDKEKGLSEGNSHTSFIITDDLKVEIISAGLTFDVLKDFGYANCDKLVQKTRNVNRKQFVALLESIFASDSALTDTFLGKSILYGMKNIHKTLSPAIRKESKDDQTIKLNAYVNKKEGKILYVECDEDFVDLLFTFLAVPLGSVGESSSNGIIANLCKSFKDLRSDYGSEAKCVLPYYYKYQKQLLDFVTIQKPQTYYRYVSTYTYNVQVYRFSENSGKKPRYDWDKLVPMIWTDPKSEDDSNNAEESTTPTDGFVKRGIKFMVTDDLSIRLSNLTSTIGLLKDQQIQCDDVKVEAIIIRKEEALRLLQASLVTSSALSTAFLAKESASPSGQQSQILRTPKNES